MCVKYGRAQELGLLLDSLTQSKHKLQLNAIALQRDKHKQMREGPPTAAHTESKFNTRKLWTRAAVKSAGSSETSR